jgi:hypothetical protein
MSNVTSEIEAVSANGRLKARVTARHDGQAIEIQTMPLDSAKCRTGFVNTVRRKCDHADPEALDAALLAYADEQLRQPPAASPLAQVRPEIPPQLREEAMAMLSSPRLFDEIADDLRRLGIAGERTLGLTLYIAMSSRILETPLGVIVQGASSSGKSHSIKRVSLLIPEQSKLVVTSMTQHALYYSSDTIDLRHKVVIVGERKQSQSPEVADEGIALRELLSERSITRMIPVKDSATGGMEERQMQRQGSHRLRCEHDR